MSPDGLYAIPDGVVVNQTTSHPPDPQDAPTRRIGAQEGMIQPAEDHLSRIKADLLRRVDAKYRLGQSEHGGVLPEIGVSALLDCAIEEALDQAVYLLTLRELLHGTRKERK